MPLAERPRAVVTGAGSGLGRALCVDLARRGARVVLSDLDVASAEETAALIGASAARVVRCDVANGEDVDALASACDAAMGGVDLVVNNAGVAVSGKVGEIPLKDWEWILGVNLWGVIHGCHYFTPRLRAQGHGAILNVASAAGLVSAPSMAPYSATKAAVVALSESLSAELAGTPISVTVLCPTFFKTNIARAGRGSTAKTDALVEKLMSRASLQADGVARFALDAVAASELYAVPHADGRWMWRLKRATPAGFTAITKRLSKVGGLGA